MLIRVWFENGRYEYVNSMMIDALIRLRRIKMFYRPSEERWIDIDLDPVRKATNINYDGIERRSSGLAGL